MKRFLSGLVTILLLTVLFGCAGDEGARFVVDESYDWRTSATLTYGQMTCEKLQLTAWDSGRMAATSQEIMAEWEQGYYLFNPSSGMLFYADRTNLDNWVPVCNRADCSHLDRIKCNAHYPGNHIYLKDGRLYGEDFVMDYPHLHNYEGKGMALISRAIDGTDAQLAYVIEDALVPGFGSSRSIMHPQGWIYSVTKLLPDGREVGTTYLVDENGCKVIAQKDYGEDGYGGGGLDEIYRCNGERVFYNNMSGDGLFRLVDGQQLPVNMTEEDVKGGGYLSGDVLRVFRPGDGYYDINLNTRQETKLADSRVPNSFAQILLPNCILEMSRYNKDAPANEARIMELFDGQQWHRVELPEELAYVNAPLFSYIGVASDRILLVATDYSPAGLKAEIYQIRLDREELVLELVGAFDH